MQKSISSSILSSVEKAKDYKGVRRIGIFGSYIKGTNTKDSDIDILFDYYYNNDNDNGIDDTLDYLDDLEQNLKKCLGNIRVDFLSYNGVMESDSQTVRDSILNDVVWLYESC